MQKLEHIKLSFETWCKENGIGVFYSDDSSSLPSIIYSDNNDEELIEFRKIILKALPPFVIIICKDVEFEKGIYESNPEWVEENDESYESHLALLDEHLNSIASLEIGFIHAGVLLSAFCYAEWHDDFEKNYRSCFEICSR